MPLFTRTPTLNTRTSLDKGGKRQKAKQSLPSRSIMRSFSTNSNTRAPPLIRTTATVEESSSSSVSSCSEDPRIQLLTRNTRDYHAFHNETSSELIASARQQSRRRKKPPSRSKSTSYQNSNKREVQYANLPSRIMRSLSMQSSSSSSRKPKRRTPTGTITSSRRVDASTYKSSSHHGNNKGLSRTRTNSLTSGSTPKRRTATATTISRRTASSATKSSSHRTDKERSRVRSNPSISRAPPSPSLHQEQDTPSIVTGVITIPERCFHSKPIIKVSIQDNSQIDRHPVTIASCILQPNYICAQNKFRFSLAYNGLPREKYHEWYLLHVRIESQDGALVCFNHRITQAIDDQGQPIQNIEIPLINALPVDVIEEGNNGDEDLSYSDDDEEESIVFNYNEKPVCTSGKAEAE